MKALLSLFPHNGYLRIHPRQNPPQFRPRSIALIPLKK